ncbi:MAG: ATP-binding protein [Alphaproteobacteria bacterium]|nr:ATP-binding protein [Alphaproteobacteria bacterium]MDD9920612.1 ATP-binding protein [Alphaproteobacteria bacterium]
MAENAYHRLLERQLKKVKRGQPEGELNIDKLLQMISMAYGEHDAVLQRNNRSLELMSEELGALNEKLRAEADDMRERFEFAVSGSNDALFDWNIETGEVYYSPRGQEMLGYRAGTFKFTSDEWKTMLHPDDVFGYVAALKDHFRGNVEHYQQRLRVCKADGDWKWLLARGQVVKWDGEGRALRMVGTHTDIDEQIQREIELEHARDAAEGASRSKSAFLANMSHEIRTPMNGIMGMAQLLLESDLNDSQMEQATVLKNSCGSLLTVINDILDFSKIEAGKLIMEEVSFDLLAMISEIQNFFSYTADEKKLDLICSTADDLPKHVVGDSVRLKQILINLLSNAFKFTEEGSVSLLVTCADAHEEKVTLEFSVIDTGTGMTPQQQQEIFKKFTQADESITRKFGGTGLGLAIVSELVSLMGGSVEVESELGVGSTFTVYVLLALPKEDDLETADDEKNYCHLKDVKDSISVLLVEDNMVNQLVAKSMLEKIGCEVTIANNGLEAVEAVEGGHSFELVLMDMQMPVMDGLTSTRKIKKMIADGDIPYVPIVALTANAMVGDKDKCMEAGMDGYLSKPVQMDDLCEQLTEVKAKAITTKKEIT